MSTTQSAADFPRQTTFFDDSMGSAQSLASSSRASDEGLNMSGILTSKGASLFSLETTRCDETPRPPPPPGSSEPPPPLPSDDIQQAAQAASAYPNPGPFERASMDVRAMVMLDTFDGFRCDINKQTSPFMAVVHSFQLGTTSSPDGRRQVYSFLTQVADEQGLLMARVDPGRGGVEGQIHRALLGGVAMGKVQMGLSQDGQADQLLAEVDFGGQTWTGNLKYGSMGGGMVYGCNYFQAITPRLHVGGEGMYVAANQGLLSNYTLRYSMPAKSGAEDAQIVTTNEGKGSSMLCANYNGAQGALTLDYRRVVTPNRVALGAQLQCSPISLESNLILAAEFKLQRSKVNMAIDGTGRIQSLVNANLGMAPSSPSINFSAEIDHAKEEMKFGYGININS